MSAPLGYTDARSSLKVTTPLGTDALLLRGFSGEEGLSTPFLFTLEMATEKSNLDVSKLLGAAATVTLIDGAGKQRLFHGLITRATVLGSSWVAELRPWLWMLTLTTDSKIFQGKTIPEIITAVFDGLGFSDYKKDGLTGSYAPLDYCVQYQETAFDFVSRLMEDAGIWYFFTHTDSAHTLVLADDASAVTPCENAAAVTFTEIAEEKRWLLDLGVWEIAQSASVAPNEHQADDFNFETPSTELLANAKGKSPTWRVYDYPGGHKAKDAGDRRSAVRLQEFAAPTSLISGLSAIRHLRPGAKITLSEHPNGALNADWAIQSVSHRAVRNEYENSFLGFAADVVWRAPRRTPRPRIVGAQTAIVTGKAGEEIWTDKYGRITVQFHWDQLGQKDEKSSCWVRVAQSWAGKGWGAWVLPRVGQEVVVSFLEGDPDQPLVTGCVYNADFPLPYALPDNQTKTTLKSNSSKDGGGFNEFRFEDKKDSEEVYLHAQKDMTVTIENSRTTLINKADDTLTIAKGKRVIAVSEGDETHTVDKGKRSLTIAGDESHTNKANYSWEISGDLTIKVQGKLTIESTGDAMYKSGAALTTQSGTAMTVKAGTALDASSGTGLTLKAGTSLDASSGTTLGVKAGATLEVKAAATGTVDGGGMLTLKGGMVKIN